MLFRTIFLNNEPSKYRINEDGLLMNSKGKVMSPYIINSGYYMIKLSHKNKKYHRLIHRLVAELFIGSIPEGFTVNHIDGNKLNNSVNNLEIISFDENIHHAMNNNLIPVGDKAYQSKYTNEQIENVCRLISTGKYSIHAIAKMTDVSEDRVSQVKRREKWKSISDKYTFPDKLPRERAIFTDEQISIIYYLWDRGFSNKDILKCLKLKKSSKYYNALYHLKHKSSTTIPLKIFLYDVTNGLEPSGGK